MKLRHESERGPHERDLRCDLNFFCQIVGSDVGARCWWLEREEFISELFKICLANFSTFEPERGTSLECWVTGCARWLAFSLFRKYSRNQKRVKCLDQDVVGREGDPAEAVFNEDSPANMSDRSDLDLMTFFERERPEWRATRDQLWTEALRMVPRIRIPLVQQVSLHDSLLETSSPRLVVPYRVIVLEESPADIAVRKGGLSTNSVHQAVSRFRGETKIHFGSRMKTLQRLARPS